MFPFFPRKKIITPEKIDSIKSLAKNGFIDVDPTFLTTDSKTIAAHVNGCGAAGARVDFVPDTVYGMSILDCCIPHDWDYEIGQDIEAKRRADRRFKNNILRKVKRVKGLRSVIKKLMRRRAKTYHSLLKHYGGPAFWDGKN